MFSIPSTELASKSEEEKSRDGCATLAFVEQRCENHWPNQDVGWKGCARAMGADTDPRLLGHTADATSDGRCRADGCR
jgi:hypothetical protein